MTIDTNDPSEPLIPLDLFPVDGNTPVRAAGAGASSTPERQGYD